MKLRIMPLAALAAFTLAGSASAAGVWSTINWTGDSSLSFITSTNVTHSADVNSAATVNGKTFETIPLSAALLPYSGSNFSIATSSAKAFGTISNATDFATITVPGTESAKLSTGFGYLQYGGETANGSTVSYTLTGLTANTNYTFSFFSAAWSTADRTGTLDGSDDVGNTYAIDQSSATGGKIYQYAYNTGASTSFTMTMTNTSTAINNGIHTFAFANTVPEPSAALLGGLGMLALLRRRR